MGISCSPVSPTNNGFPEGDPFSVLAMIGISWAWINSLLHSCQGLRPTAYADNWGWSTTNPRHHSPAIDLTVSYCQLIGMSLDWAKCWLWSTQKLHGPFLRQAFARHVDSQQVQILMTQADLGFQQTYSGPPRIAKTKERFQQAAKLLLNLQNMPHDLQTKTKLVQSGVYTLAFYGTEVILLWKVHTDAMRHQAAAALYGTNNSRNSAIALLCTQGIVDPELAIVQHAMLAARRFLWKCSAAERQQSLLAVSRHSGLHQECKGPAGSLKYYLCRLGWTIHKFGNINVSGFFQISFLNTSQITLKKWMMREWQQQLLAMHCDHKPLRGLPPISRDDTLAVLAKFTPQERRRLVNQIAGGFQTGEQKAKWSDCDSACQLCSQPDTRHHRMYTCTALDELRRPFQRHFQDLQDQGSLIHELPVIHVHELQDWVVTCHYHMPEPDIDFHLYHTLHQMDIHGQTLRFFTDGSCHLPASRTARYASMAVVFDVTRTDTERQGHAKQYRNSGTLPSTFLPVVTTKVFGEQIIHRAELLGIVYICERFSNTHIYTDSTVTLSGVTKCLETDNVATLSHLEDFDLLERLHACIHLGTKQFSKVKAHDENDMEVDLLTTYHRLGNKAVNDLAVLANQYLSPALRTDMERIHKDISQQQANLVEAYKFFLLAGKFHAGLHSQQNQPAQREPQRTSRVDILTQLTAFKVSQPWTPPQPGHHMFHDCAWGPTIASLFREWMLTVKWPTLPDMVPWQNIGITWIELALSFALFAGLILPMRRADAQGNEYLQTFPTMTAARAHNVKLSELANQTSNLFKQVSDLQQFALWPDIRRCLVKSLYVQGANIESYGFQWRAELPNQKAVLQILHLYLTAHKDPAFTVLPEMILNMPGELHRRIKGETQGLWQKRSLTSQTGARNMRNWRKRPQSQLVFS